MYSIGPITMNDFGVYECVATRGPESTNTEIDFSVDGPLPPDYVVIQPPQAHVPLGTNFQFECLALGEFGSKVHVVSSKNGSNYWGLWVELDALWMTDVVFGMS